MYIIYACILLLCNGVTAICEFSFVGLWAHNRHSKTSVGMKEKCCGKSRFTSLQWVGGCVYNYFQEETQVDAGDMLHTICVGPQESFWVDSHSSTTWAALTTGDICSGSIWRGKGWWVKCECLLKCWLRCLCVHTHTAGCPSPRTTSECTGCWEREALVSCTPVRVRPLGRCMPWRSWRRREWRRDVGRS